MKKYFDLIKKIDTLLDLDSFSTLIPDTLLSKKMIRKKYDKHPDTKVSRVIKNYGVINNYVDYYIRKTNIILIVKKNLNKELMPLEN